MYISIYTNIYILYLYLYISISIYTHRKIGESKTGFYLNDGNVLAPPTGWASMVRPRVSR